MISEVESLFRSLQVPLVLLGEQTKSDGDSIYVTESIGTFSSLKIQPFHNLPVYSEYFSLEFSVAQRFKCPGPSPKKPFIWQPEIGRFVSNRTQYLYWATSDGV